jgi:hypothetical protein
MPDKRIVWRPHHRYVDFKIVECTGLSEDMIKSLEEDLKDSNSDIRRDVREMFDVKEPGEYTLPVFVVPGEIGAGCIIKFRKIK